MEVREMTEAEVVNLNKILPSLILAQSRVTMMVHCGWTEFEDEARSLEKKIHALWRESGREDVPTFELCLWAKEQGADFTNPFF